MDEVILGGGCFWGMEELFRLRPGVVDTTVGYAGGKNDHPTFEFHPGHAESIKISFDSSLTSRAELLDYFFQIHDPTTLNQQGNDIGSSYRSVIFYQNEAERQAAKEAIRRNQPHWSSHIITAIEPLTEFWPAEDFHQNYLQKHLGGYTCHYERSR